MTVRGFLNLVGVLVVLLAGLMSGPSVAAIAGPPACPKFATRIVVLGDSLADGLWGSLRRTYARCPMIETLRLTKVSDGLAKTSSDGWLARYTEVATDLKTSESDIVIVQIGANDITTIRNGHSRETFSTEAWNKLYSERVMGLMRGLRARAGSVIWFGLPIVGKSSFETPYNSISALQQAAVKSAGGTFIDIHDLTKFGTGDFAMNGSYEGRVQQLRASDKVHFTRSGYDYVAGVVLDDLTRIIAERDRRAAIQNVQLQ